MTEPTFQVSDKVGDAIIVVRGTSAQEFAQNLQAFASDASIMNAVNAFSGAVKGASPQQAYQNVQQGLGAQLVPQPPYVPPQAPQSQAPWDQGQQTQAANPFTCPHGQRVEKSGRNARGAWQAYFCPAKAEGCKPMNPDGTLWSR